MSTPLMGKSIARMKMRVSNLDLKRPEDSVVVFADNTDSKIIPACEIKFILPTEKAPAIGQEIHIEIMERS